jgi:hypothetical protein
MGDLEPSGPASNFDMLAASLRADAADLKTFMEVLATKLADALPNMVRVEREGGLFKKEHRVQAIRIQIEEHGYELRRAASGIEARLNHQVRGIVLKNEVMRLDQWIEALSAHLTRHAESSASARNALDQMVR